MNPDASYVNNLSGNLTKNSTTGGIFKRSDSIEAEKLTSEENEIATSERRWSSQACNVLYDLRRNSQLCDAILTTDDKVEFHVHRAILAASSKYFRALFTNGMDDTHNKPVLISGVDSDILKCIIGKFIFYLL